MPSSAIRSVTDPWNYQALVRGSNLKVFVSTPGQYKAELTTIDMDRLGLQRVETSLPQISHASLITSHNGIYFLTDAQQAPIYQNGIELPPGVIAVYPPGAELYRRMSTGTRWGTMCLTPDDLAAAGQALVDYELTAPAVIRLIRPPADLMSRLLHLHESAGRLAATVPNILAHPEVSRAMEQALVQAMVRCLAEGLEVGTASPRQQRLPVMRRLEQVLEENPDRSLYVAEICAAIGVSDRTLRLHCEQHLGMSPHRYLWLRRMNFVRRALAVADPAAATVTGIALDYGFGELGRFAVQYRKLFGQSPSATLRNAPNFGRSERR